MHPYQNYPYPYPPHPMCNWFHPYYHQCNPCPDYFNNRYHSQPQNQRRFFGQIKKQYNSNEQVIKIEEESDPKRNYQKNNDQCRNKKKQKNGRKRKKMLKLLKGQKNTYLHPRKQIKNKVRYFDPNSAPSVTTAAYNLVEDTTKQDERNQKFQQMPEEDINQLGYSEQFQDPFIVFKHRRIKKKFKKYLGGENPSYFMSTIDRSGSDNEQECQSQSSFSISSSETNKNKNSKKGGKLSQINKSVRCNGKEEDKRKGAKRVSKSKSK